MNINFFNFKKEPDAPWSKFYKDIDMNLKVPNTSFYEYFREKTLNFGGFYCLDYYGKKIKYNELLGMIDECAKGLYDYGIRKGDVVSICLPNMIEGVVSFFAINKLGAIANFIHPLSSENELKKSINDTKSRLLIILDANFLKLKNIEKDIDLKKIILVDVYTYMPFVINFFHKFSKRLKLELEEYNLYIFWNMFMFKTKKISDNDYAVDGNMNDSAVILSSGGTTGIPKGVVLSNENLMAYIESDIRLSPDIKSGDTILSIIPIFHGFGLVSNVLFGLCMGMFVVLRPKFDVNEYCKMMKKYKPQCISGVPTLFESVFDKLDKSSINLSCLKYVVCGGDTLKTNLRDKINRVLKEHNSDVKVTVGYGLTEAVCAVVIESKFIEQKENTVGIPFPGVYVGIFSEDNKKVPYGEEGEICITGPTVMKYYYNNENETELVLRKHKDGNIWLHTGDLGYMDEEGYLTYLSRIKRMIISSGYNIYPTRIEEILEEHPAISMCAVVAIPHKKKIEVPKVYIVLKEGYNKNEKLLVEFKSLIMKNLPKYAWPVEYEFRDELPVTKFGKIDYKNLK